jgi:hypothetical protein
MTLFRLGLLLLFAWPAYHLMLVVFSWRGTSASGRDRRPPDGPPPAVFWIVVPCLNEERVVERTVRSAVALAAPDART